MLWLEATQAPDFGLWLITWPTMKASGAVPSRTAGALVSPADLSVPFALSTLDPDHVRHDDLKAGRG
jgi:hypothetical protein